MYIIKMKANDTIDDLREQINKLGYVYFNTFYSSMYFYTHVGLHRGCADKNTSSTAGSHTKH